MTDDRHLKINIAHEDAAYIQKKVMEAVDSRVNIHMPSSNENHNPDPMRKRVEELVHTFVSDTLLMTFPNMIIDGQPFVAGKGKDILKLKPENEEIEPFDLELSERLRALYAQVDTLTLDISKLRRQAPQLVANKYREAMKSDTQDVYLDISPDPIDADKLTDNVHQDQAEFYELLELLEELKKEGIPEAQLQVEQVLESLKFF